jgi:hypothetical protein
LSQLAEALPGGVIELGVGAAPAPLSVGYQLYLFRGELGDFQFVAELYEFISIHEL